MSDDIDTNHNCTNEVHMPAGKGSVDNALDYASSNLKGRRRNSLIAQA